jgi:hypothetical protein
VYPCALACFTICFWSSSEYRFREAAGLGFDVVALGARFLEVRLFLVDLVAMTTLFVIRRLDCKKSHDQFFIATQYATPKSPF